MSGKGWAAPTHRNANLWVLPVCATITATVIEGAQKQLQRTAGVSKSPSRDCATTSIVLQATAPQRNQRNSSRAQHTITGVPGRRAIALQTFVAVSAHRAHRVQNSAEERTP